MLMNLNWFMFKFLGVWKEKLNYFADILYCGSVSGPLIFFIHQNFLSQRKVARQMKT